MTTILVAGVHGVGKTTLSMAASAELHIYHATASQLISSERMSSDWLTDKRVWSADHNQSVLVSVVNKLQARYGDLIIDGHFVLRGPDFSIVEISTNIIRSLMIDAVILVDDEVDAIFNRLQRRDDVSWSVEELEKLLEREEARAVEVAAELGIYYEKLSCPNVKSFTAAVRRVLNKGLSHPTCRA